MKDLATHVRVTAAALKRAGVFEACDVSQRYELKIDGRQVVASYNCRDQTANIAIYEDNKYVMHSMEKVVQVESGKGRRFYFICRYTQGYVDAIYFNKSYIASIRFIAIMKGAEETRKLSAARLVSRLDGVDGRAPARGENRERLKQKLADKEAANVIFAERRAPKAEGADLAGASQARSRRGAATPLFVADEETLDLYDEEAEERSGLLMHPARYVSPVIAAATFKEFQSSWSHDELTLPQEHLSEGKVMLESCPGILFSDFITWHKREHGAAFGRRLSWEETEEKVLVYWPGAPWKLLGVEVDAESASKQFIEIAGRKSGVEAAFICPITRERTPWLVLRSGRFGSPKAQRVS